MEGRHLSDGVLNVRLPRNRRRCSPLYYRGFDETEVTIQRLIVELEQTLSLDTFLQSCSISYSEKNNFEKKRSPKSRLNFGLPLYKRKHLLLN